MTTDRPVLVTGASGTTGSRVVAGLLEAGRPVRAAARDAASIGVRDGVDAVRLDLTDPSTWPAAFTGVQQLYLVRPPQLARPRTQVLPALEAARAHGVQHVVLLSLQGAERLRVVPHATIEAWLRSSGLAWTFVRAAFFMQNLTGTLAADIRERGEIVVPAGDGRTAFVDAADVAAVATQALLHPVRHSGQAWTPTGPAALTYDEVAATLTQVLGREVRYTRPGLLRYARHARSLGLPPGMVAVTSAIYTAARLGTAASLTDDVRQVTGRPPTTLATMLHREAATVL